MDESVRWEHLLETLTIMTQVLSRGPNGSSVRGLPPPISPDMQEHCDEMLRRWLPDPSQPLPGGEVQAAALARVQAAVIFAMRAQEFEILPVPKGEHASAVSRLLLTQQAVLSAVWSKYWDQVK